MKELRNQLWDFVYGLLDEADAARLRERITSDRQVAREYSRVKLQSELLAQAARASSAERELPSLPERPGTAATGRLSGVRLVVFGGSLALSLGLLLFAGTMYWSDGTTLRGPAVAQALEDYEQGRHPRLIVTGPQVLEPRAGNTYDVTVQSLNGESLNAPVVASIEDVDGNQLWYESSQTGLDGKHTVELPAEKLQGPGVRLKIAVAPDAAGAEMAANGPPLVTWLPIQKQHGDLSVVNRVSDGERVYFREAEIRTLDRSDVSDSVDKVAESSRNEIMQRDKKLRLEERASLTEEAKGVRWGAERFAQLGEESKVRIRPADDSKSEKSEPGDSVKQVREALPGASKSASQALPGATKSASARTPMSLGKPGEESQKDPFFDLPVALPGESQPAPDTPAPAASGKEEKPSLQPTAPARGTAPAPVARREPADSPTAEEDEADPVELSKNGRQILLESITANDKLLASRMVDGTEAATSLEQRIDDLRREGKIDDKFSGRIGLALYDASVAPPQKVSEASIEIPPSIEALHCTIRFDREEYRVGDLVTADLQVTDSNHEALSAVLNVQVDAIPLSESDVEESAAPPQYLFTKAESPQVPLIFDNATQQAHNYEQSLTRRLVEQRAAQRRTALLLLSGSSVGVVLLLVAGVLSWLPRTRYWLPVAALLGISGLLGVSWLPREPSPPQVAATRPMTPLTTFGVQVQPPVAERAGGASATGPAELESLRRLRQDDLLALDESRLPEMPTSDTADGTMYSLVAMSDWKLLAGAKDGRDSNVAEGTESTVPAQADYLRPDVGMGYFGYFENQLAQKGRELLGGEPARQDWTDNSEKLAQMQTIYWHPRLTTDPSGKCRVQFYAPHSPRAHRLTVIAHSTGRLGTATETIPTVVPVPRR